MSQYLEQAGQRRRIREWLWDPLAVAALNQSPDEAAATTFVRVLAALFGPRASDSALALPTVPLHVAYAVPARSFIVARGGDVRTKRWRACRPARRRPATSGSTCAAG